MRSYGSDKPDCRIPPMHPVEDLLPELANARTCRWWRSTFPATGAPSRKERDELKAFGQERGLRVYDDAKRLERDYPEPDGPGARALRRRRERSAAAGRLGRRAQGPSSRGDRLPGVRPVAPALRAEVQRPPQAARPARISSSCGWWTSRCSSGTKKRTAGTPRTIPSPRCTTKTWRS